MEQRSYEKQEPETATAIEEIPCNLNKEVLDYIMDDLLHHCDLYVYGYNKTKDEYWAKTKNNVSFLLKTNNHNITVSSNSGNPILEQEFYIKLTETLDLYQNSLSAMV